MRILSSLLGGRNLHYAILPSARTLLVFALGLLRPLDASAADLLGYSDEATAADARFGSSIGAGSQWQSGLGPGSSSAIVSFGGGVRLGCSGVDFDGFLRSFDPSELLNEMRTSLLTGAQAAVSNYLLTMAYANPTIASVLDMMDKRFSARFAAFAQGCNAQEARARGEDAGARAMADAGDQCFGQEIARGTAPTEAYRRCSVLRDFESLDIPAAASTSDFLRRYTTINVTKELEALLALLPDDRVVSGSYQMRPPQATLATMSDRLRARARAALDQVDAGGEAGNIPSCGPEAMLGDAVEGQACLPATAKALVTSGAFQGARLLAPTSRALFKDALSLQIAVSAMYSCVLDLFQQVSRIDVRGDANADAGYTRKRRRRLREAVADLLQEAETQLRAQETRAVIVRSQMLALEHVESRLESRSRAADSAAQYPQFGVRDLLRLFRDSE